MTKLFSSILVVSSVGILLAATANASRLGESISNIQEQQQRSLTADTYIFQTINDGYAQLTTSNASEKEGTPCTAGRTVNYIADASGDYIDIKTDKWSSGGYRMDCMDKGSHTGWQCWASCSPFANPNFMDWGYLTFEVRVSGVFDDVCKPSVSITKRWPSYGSNVVALEGDYIDGGSTSDTDWRRAVIPIADFATEEWSNLEGVKDMYFRTCGTSYSVSPRYHVRDLYLTDDPPSVEAISTEAPTQASVIADTYIYQTVNDGYAQLTTSNASEKEGTPCTAGRTVNYIADASGDYIDIKTDKWSSGGYRMDCMDKGSHTGWQCWASCSPFANPNFMDWGYLTFEVRVSGVFDDVCKPSVSITKRWPSYGSNVVALEGDYIDGGSTSDTEWRRVVIPITDFSTEEWPNLDGVKDMYFRTCGTSVSPRYHVRDLYLIDDPPSVESYSAAPSESPTLAPPMDDVSLATHRKIHTNWYPVFGPGREPDGNSWYVVENNSWPIISASPEPRTTTVFIPAGQNVVYSTDDGIVYDKVIIEGALTIEPVDADVKLVAGTIVVEKGGSLDIVTNESEHTVVVEFDGALDTTTDPEEIMLGILALEGSLTIKGNAVPRKMAPLSQTVMAGSNSLVFNEDLLLQVGDEVVVPDTQEGLNVGHWNFPAVDNYTDQTETCTIVAASGNQVICAVAFEYDHSIGSHVAFTTRSIIIKSSHTSTDRGHILHTGEGKFDVRNARIENCGRTTTELISNTVMAPDADFNFPEGFAKMVVSTYAENQIARYALHAHNSLVEAYYSGLVVLPVGRDGMVAHNSRVHIDDNVVIGADGTGIFLEDGTETGPVTNNYIIGRGGGSRGGDDGRFSLSSGIDMAHGGFGIWVRGKLALVEGNHCEGHFGRAPYAFFVHPNFMKDKVVPAVSGTDPFLAGKKLRDIEPTHTNGLQLQSFGGFVGNTAVGTFQIGIDLSYFSVKDGDEVGSVIEGASIRNLAKNGRGISTIHSKVFTLNEVTIEGTVEDNTITGIFCNNCNGCILSTPNTTLVVENVMTVRGGNC